MLKLLWISLGTLATTLFSGFFSLSILGCGEHSKCPSLWAMLFLNNVLQDRPFHPRSTKLPYCYKNAVPRRILRKAKSGNYYFMLSGGGDIQGTVSVVFSAVSNRACINYQSSPDMEEGLVYSPWKVTLRYFSSSAGNHLRFEAWPFSCNQQSCHRLGEALLNSFPGILAWDTVENGPLVYIP